MPLSPKKITFPHMGNYYVAIKPIAQLLADEVVVPPPITRRTLELGSRYSPESVCVPFKYNMGNFIESLEKGANIIIQAGGGCRFGYYGEVQKEILKKLGYEFEFIKLNNNYGILTEVVNIKKKYNPALSYYKIGKTLLLSYQRLRAIDTIEEMIRKNIGFEKNKGEHETLHKQFLSELDKTTTIWQARSCKKKYIEAFNKIGLEKPDDCLKVGLVGEFYVLLEPFSNFFIEKELGKKGIAIEKFTTFSSIIHDILSFDLGMGHVMKYARPYLKYHIGAHGSESVGMAQKLAKEGYDGIIHVKPFACMPEVNAMSALHRISKDYKIPIMYFSFDSQTSETGIKTRIEAFHDMLIMKKNTCLRRQGKLNA